MPINARAQHITMILKFVFYKYVPIFSLTCSRISLQKNPYSVFLDTVASSVDFFFCERTVYTACNFMFVVRRFNRESLANSSKILNRLLND